MNRSEGRAPESRSLERTSAGTLHHQIYVALLKMLEDGDVAPGERMPTEAEIVSRYSVSRTTARRALDELRRQGLVDRRPGRGTFAVHPPLNARIPHLHTVAEELEQLGYEPGIVPLGTDVTRASPELAKALHLIEGDRVLNVRRIRTANGKPVYVTEVTINVTDFPSLADADFSSAAMYTLFEKHTGLRTARAAQWLSAVPANPAVAKALKISRNDPVLKLERTVYMENDAPIAVVIGYFHGHMYRHYSESHARL